MRFALLLLIASNAFAWPTASVPDFEATSTSGENFRLADHIGKEMIVLNFVQSWCGPCREEVPALNRFFQENRGRNLQLVAIDPGEGLNTVKAFATRLGFGYPVLPDNGELQGKLGVNGFPFTVVIGVDGKIQYSALGVVDIPGTLTRLLNANARVLKERGGLSKDAYLKMASAPIHLAPPEAKPAPGFVPDPAVPNRIFDVKVVSESPTEMEIEIEYSYSGDHGNQRIYVDCDPIQSDGKVTFWMRPAAVAIGRNTVRTQLGSTANTDEGAVSTKIRCEMNSRIDQARLVEPMFFNHRKTWQKGR